MSFPQRADHRRRRLAHLRIAAAVGLIAGSFLVRPGASGAEDKPVSKAPVSKADAEAQAKADEACANVSGTVSVIGSSSAKEALTRWASAICASAGVVADYTDFGSKGGREAVTPADAQVIGLTSLPFTTEEQEALKEQKRGIVLVPMITSAIACTYWDTNPAEPATSGSRFPNLRISRGTLADISSGSPRDGTNASVELAADNKDNPDYKVGPPYLNIEPWFRSGSSAVAYRLTEWFKQDPEAAEDFVKSSFEGYTLPFEDIGTPDGSSPSLINDYATMKSRMLGALQNLGIGCMDNATARTDAKTETEAVEALNIALLDNEAGKFVAPTNEAVTAAATASTPNADGTFTPDWDSTDPKIYPLPLMVYAAMPTCGIDAATRTQMDKIMTYAIGAGQKDLPPGNVAMPKTVSDTAARQLASWRKLSEKAAPCTPVEGTTTTSTSAPTSTTQPEGGTYVPPTDPGGTGGGGVYNDPGYSGTGSGSGSGSGSGAGSSAAGDTSTGEVAAAPAAGGGGGTTGPADATAEPTTPLRRIVAFASGSEAVPPAALLLGGSALLFAGPVLQIFGGLKRAGTLPAVALAWFLRLKP